MSGRLGNKAVIKFSYRVESKPSAYFNKSANTVPCNSLCLASIIQRVNRKRCVPNGVPNWVPLWVLQKASFIKIIDKARKDDQ